MYRKNHAAAKLADHDFVIDLSYIRRRETHCIVNKISVPAWVTFALWSLAKGLKTKLRESLSSESKYVTVIIREWLGPQKKSKDREFIVRFSDHAWIDRGIFRKPDFEVGIRALSLLEVTDQVEKISESFKAKIEIGNPNVDGHRCELQKRQFVNENKKLRFYVFCPVCNMRSEYCVQEHIAERSYREGQRFPFEVNSK